MVVVVVVVTGGLRALKDGLYSLGQVFIYKFRLQHLRGGNIGSNSTGRSSNSSGISGVAAAVSLSALNDAWRNMLLSLCAVLLS